MEEERLTRRQRIDSGDLSDVDSIAELFYPRSGENDQKSPSQDRDANEGHSSPIPQEQSSAHSSQGHSDSEVPYSQDTGVSSQTLAILNQRGQNDDTCSEYLRKGFMNVCPDLRNVGPLPYDLPLEVVQDENNLFHVERQHEITMDSASKSFQLVPHGDSSNYMQPYEGAYYCYVERCNSMNIPSHISAVLYFYYSLLMSIKANGLTGSVIPLESMTIKKMKNDKGLDAKKIVAIFEDIVAGSGYDDQAPVDGSFTSNVTSINDVLRERDVNGSDHLLEREPFTIRIAFTGAFFEVDGITKQELFCVAIITPLRAFNLIGYIRDYFTTPPKPPPAREHWVQMDFCYKKIQMFEANNNCGLKIDPASYKHDIGGTGGFISILCMLNLPLRIAWILRNLRHDEVPENIRIIGLPRLSFVENGTMEQYKKYMHAYINEQVEIYDEFERCTKIFYSTQEPEQSELSFGNIRSPGGWPLKHCVTSDQKNEFQRFGLFPFPLVMSFNYQKYTEKPSRDSFMLNVGQEPDTVVKKKRDFATFNQEAGASSIMPDSSILMSTEVATPLKILDKYYGPNSKPAEEFKDTKLIKWYEAIRAHLHSLLGADEITPDEAMVQLKRHLDSCMEQHMCILKTDAYGSSHFEQCGLMIDKMLDTKLATVSNAANLRHIKETQAPESIRHDSMLSTSFAMLQSWVNFNKHACLYATNSEAALDILLSSLLWHLGAHSSTMTAFFQGTLLVGACGHLEVLIDKIFYIDWRKPNSSGAGAIQVALNEFFEELGLQYRIMSDDNRLAFINPNRNTMAAIENESCIITVNGDSAEVKSKPSADMKDMPALMLENRGDFSLDSLIRFVFPRDRASSVRNVTMTTMDLDKTNDRSVALKKQICNINVCGFCTNQKKGTDEPKTLICVTHVCNPGAPAYYKISDQSGEINRVQCELNDGRSGMPSGSELLIILKQIFYSKIFSSVMVALPHRAGMLPFKINATSSAFLDWLYMVIRSHMFGVFNTHMIENFGRIKVTCSSFFACRR